MSYNNKESKSRKDDAKENYADSHHHPVEKVEQLQRLNLDFNSVCDVYAGCGNMSSFYLNRANKVTCFVLPENLERFENKVLNESKEKLNLYVGDNEKLIYDLLKKCADSKHNTFDLIDIDGYGHPHWIFPHLKTLMATECYVVFTMPVPNSVARGPAISQMYFDHYGSAFPTVLDIIETMKEWGRKSDWYEVKCMDVERMGPIFRYVFKFSKSLARNLVDKPKERPRFTKVEQDSFRKSIVHKINLYFESNERGKVIMACGTGKTLVGYKSAIKYDKIIIAFPNLGLQAQTFKVWTNQCLMENKDHKFLCIGSDKEVNKSLDGHFGTVVTTDIDEIVKFLVKNKSQKYIVFSTYQSGQMLAQASKIANARFNFGIFDEGHHLAGESGKQMSHLLFEENINIDKRLIMTATERIFEENKDEVICMNDEELFGKTIYNLGIREAIERGLICDYKLLGITCTEKEIREFIEKNSHVIDKENGLVEPHEMRMLASAIVVVKAIEEGLIKKIITYHLYKARARAFCKLIVDIAKIYNVRVDAFNVDGEMPMTQRLEIQDQFINSSAAILSNARALTEGIDIKEVDGVAFVDPKTSLVDIVQASGRAWRLCDKDKVAKVIIPVLIDNKKENDSNFGVMISLLKSLSLSDEKVAQEIKKRKESGENNENNENKFIEIRTLTAQYDVDLNKVNQVLKLAVFKPSLERYSYKEFKKVILEMGIKSSTHYVLVKQQGDYPRLPACPSQFYKNRGWESWPIVLQSIKPYPFDQWLNIINKAKIESRSQYNEFRKKSKDVRLPSVPEKTYKEQGWTNWYFVTGKVKKDNFYPYSEWLIIVRENGATTRPSYAKFRERQQDPLLHSNPHVLYARTKEWPGWNKVGERLELISFEELMEILDKNNIKNYTEYFAYRQKTDDVRLPAHPKTTCERQGHKWPGWKKSKLGDWYSYEQFVQFMKNHPEITTALAYKFMYKTYNDPLLPSEPKLIYKGFDWKAIFPKKDLISFEEFLSILKKNPNIKTKWDYEAFRLANPKLRLSKCPNLKYKDQWPGWQNLLKSIHSV